MVGRIQTALKIYPNPASEYIEIETSGKARFEMFDLVGKEALAIDCIDQIRLPVGFLKKGVYVYRLVAGGQTDTGKVIIQ